MMDRIRRQIVRGCGSLPHVGPHPGTQIIALLILVSGLAGASRGGLAGFILAGLASCAICGPIYLYGAWGRAQASDRIASRQPSSNT